MPLETGDKISELNPLWPLGSDPKSQGDDHLRLIKKIMQSDVASLAEGGDFVTAPTVPDGATGKQAVNADDVPLLAGTGPVEIVEADAAEISGQSSGWQVWGDTLIQWGRGAMSNGEGTIVFDKPFKYPPRVTASIQQGSLAAGEGRVTWLNVPTTTEAPIFGRNLANGAVSPNGGAPYDWIAVGEAPDDMKKPKIVTAIGNGEFPVGYIWMSTQPINLNQILGYGDWQPYAEGRVIVGVGNNGESDWTAGQERGSETHTLTVDEMPAHSHVFNGNVGDTGNDFGGSGKWNRNLPRDTSTVGGDAAHNNIQPSIACYMYERVS